MAQDQDRAGEARPDGDHVAVMLAGVATPVPNPRTSKNAPLPGATDRSMHGWADHGRVGGDVRRPRTIRRFTEQPVDDATLARCLEAATWAPSGANAQAWRFVVLRSPEHACGRRRAAAQALEVIEPVYGMTRPAADDDSRRARTNRATYELHDRAGELTSVLFAQQRFPTASELLLGGSIFPAMQNFLLAARALGPGRVPHQLGVVRGRAAAPGGRRRARRLDARRPRRGGMAPREPRTGAPSPPRRRRLPRPVGSARLRDRQLRSIVMSVASTRSPIPSRMAASSAGRASAGV